MPVHLSAINVLSALASKIVLFFADDWGLLEPGWLGLLLEGAAVLPLRHRICTDL